MTERHFSEDDLDRLLAAERAAAPDVPAALLSRILADAQAEQAAQMRATWRRAAPRRGLVAVLRDLGGWPAMAGLAAATVAGLWIGISPPPALLDGAQQVWSADDVDYLVDLSPEDLLFPLEEGTTL